CGFCLSHCPVYRAVGVEGSSPRGHNVHLRALWEGAMEPSTELAAYLKECLLCGSCWANCFGGVRTHELVAAGRHGLTGRFGQPWGQGLFLRHVLSEPRRLSFFFRLLRLGERHWPADWVRPLGAPAGSSPPLPASPLRDRLVEILKSGAENPGPSLAYFLGCGMNHLLPEAGEATLRLLLARGFRVQVPPVHCCGLPPYSLGDLRTAQALARRNLRRLSRLKVEAIVVDCAGCFSFLQGYPELLASEPELAAEAASLAERVVELSAFFSSVGLPSARTSSPMLVTYHDPCHLRHHRGISAPPRSLIRSREGIRYVEMPQPGLCCGGAGSYRLTHPRRSEQILERKLEGLVHSRAELLVTSCPACLIQLSHGVRRTGLPVEVLHLSQLLARGV
ncbi:MAG: (Fe-S)-binding protein, partial [Candidatus Tectomicrobia bacterium]|nr:(Fe-S)-binding protein [Candidatus Tectomicrobia bacterium]